MDSTAQTAPRDSKIINDLLSCVTVAFDSTKTPRYLEIINELLSRVIVEVDSPNSF